MQSHTVRKTTDLARDAWAARPRGWQLVSLLVMTGGLMRMAAGAAVPEEIEAISTGNPLAAKGFCLSLLIGATIFGALAGAVDTTGTRCIAETLPDSPLAITIKALLSRLIYTMTSWWAYASVIALRAGASASRILIESHRLPLPTADLWPAGNGPRLVYESQPPSW